MAWLSFCAVFVMCDVVSLRSAIAQESVNFWEAHQTEIRAIGLSPKGKVIISGSSTGEMTAWDVKSKKSVCKFSGHGDSVSSLVFLNESTFLSGSADGTVRKWLVGKTEPLVTLASPPSHYISTLLPLSETSWLAGSFRSILKSMDEQEFDVWLKGGGAIGVFDICLDKQMLGAGGKPRHISLYDLQSKELKQSILLPENGADGTPLPDRIRSIRFSPDGNHLLVLCANRANSCVFLVDLKSSAISLVNISSEGPRCGMLFSPDGGIFAVAGFDILVFDTASAKLIKKIDGSESDMWPKPNYYPSIAFVEISESLKLLAGTRDGKIVELGMLVGSKKLRRPLNKRKE